MTHLMPLPAPTERMQEALDDLALLTGGRDIDPRLLTEETPRLWDITTIIEPELRWDVWIWLEAFVIWLNSQHTWISQDQIPPCWPEHPPLVHAINSLAFQRLEAGDAGNATTLEEWHRYALPSFIERTKEQRLGCNETHTPWPGRAAMNRHLHPDAATRRRRAFTRDCEDDDPDTTMPLRIVDAGGGAGAQIPQRDVSSSQ